MVVGGDGEALRERPDLERRGQIAAGRPIQRLLVQAPRQRRAARDLLRELTRGRRQVGVIVAIGPV
jgi:hypothetical protein